MSGTCCASASRFLRTTRCGVRRARPLPACSSLLADGEGERAVASVRGMTSGRLVVAQTADCCGGRVWWAVAAMAWPSFIGLGSLLKARGRRRRKKEGVCGQKRRRNSKMRPATSAADHSLAPWKGVGPSFRRPMACDGVLQDDQNTFSTSFLATESIRFAQRPCGCQGSGLSRAVWRWFLLGTPAQPCREWDMARLGRGRRGQRAGVPQGCRPARGMRCGGGDAQAWHMPRAYCIAAREGRRERDSNPRDAHAPNGFQDRRIQPLCHLSVTRNDSIE